MTRKKSCGCVIANGKNTPAVRRGFELGGYVKVECDECREWRLAAVPVAPPSSVSSAYQAIKEFYGDRTAKRSGVPLINHIDEGLIILKRYDADQDTLDAYCLHPLTQADGELVVFDPSPFSPRAVMLAMEYRHTANAYLASNTMPAGGIKRSPLVEVDLMLIADKVQNRKDFLIHHQAHPNFARLDEYFKEWLAALNVSESDYQELLALIAVAETAHIGVN